MTAAVLALAQRMEEMTAAMLALAQRMEEKSSRLSGSLLFCSGRSPGTEGHTDQRLSLEALAGRGTCPGLYK